MGTGQSSILQASCPYPPAEKDLMHEPDAQQAIENLAGELAGVSHIGHIETRNKRS